MVYKFLCQGTGTPLSGGLNTKVSISCLETGKPSAIPKLLFRMAGFI
jgi:hypothetical protein